MGTFAFYHIFQQLSMNSSVPTREEAREAILVHREHNRQHVSQDISRSAFVRRWPTHYSFFVVGIA
jgi:hypothetical protein